MIKSDHNFVHVATAQLFSDVHNYGLDASLESKLEKNNQNKIHLWALKHFIKYFC